MKKLVNFLNEAKKPAPSALKKFKQGKDNVECEFIAGDGDGYIMDKNGNVYDVK